MNRAAAWGLVLAAVVGGRAAAADMAPLGADFLRPTLQEPVTSLDDTTWTVEGRYWLSTGRTAYAINSSRVDPSLGNPTSRLQYDKLSGQSGEVEIRSDEPVSGLFGKAMVGIGGITGGTLRDQDWFRGQVLFSDTLSRVQDGRLAFVTIDGGTRWDGLSGRLVTTGVFAGYGFWGEKAPARGIRCNPDDVGNIDCPLGVDLIPPTASAIRNHVNWHMLRLGVETKVRIGSMLTLSGEIAVIPIAFLANDDYHNNRRDLGLVPNVFQQAPAFGVQAQAFATLNLTQNWSIGAGARYWRVQTYEGSGDTKFGKGVFSTSVALNKMESSRYGLLATSALRF